MKHTLLSIMLVSSISSTASAATGALSQKNMSLDIAEQLASSVIEACAKDNYNVSVTVVDRSGMPLVMKRMDNAGPHTLEASRMKAFTSLTTKNSTDNVMKTAQSNPGAANMSNIPGFLLLAGGVPVKSGDEIIGAVGVGGAPGGHLDQICALEGIEKIKNDLTEA